MKRFFCSEVANIIVILPMESRLFRMILPQMLCATSSLLTLLSDLPTPAFLLDVSALKRFAFQRRAGTNTASWDNADGNFQSRTIPSVVLPYQGISLYPAFQSNDGNFRLQFDAPQCETLFSDNDPSTTPLTGDVFCFLHASVIRSRNPKDTNTSSTFIAELDLPPSLCRDTMVEPYLVNRDPAQLCLGLNNHHVGGYYWARASGSGSSMDAPGVRYVDAGDDRGMLIWDKNGPQECNSNDGKRSEWVNFLRVGDTIQLIPSSAEHSLAQFVKYYDNEGQSECIRVYGITNDGRPLGSDPLVVCEFRCDL